MITLILPLPAHLVRNNYIYYSISAKDGGKVVTYCVREVKNKQKCWKEGNEYKFNREYLGVAVS